MPAESFPDLVSVVLVLLLVILVAALLWLLMRKLRQSQMDADGVPYTPPHLVTPGTYSPQAESLINNPALAANRASGVAVFLKDQSSTVFQALSTGPESTPVSLTPSYVRIYAPTRAQQGERDIWDPRLVSVCTCRVPFTLKAGGVVQCGAFLYLERCR